MRGPRGSCSSERAPSDRRARADREKPHVSIIVPCCNEAETIGHPLEALARQDLGRGDLEVPDEMSDAGTRKMARPLAGPWTDFAMRMPKVNPATVQDAACPPFRTE